jgi:poly-gamma-glutamate capsule biosynthesis protein CapA/YwtB (metallophosphatase superfamily)
MAKLNNIRNFRRLASSLVALVIFAVLLGGWNEPAPLPGQPGDNDLFQTYPWFYQRSDSDVLNRQSVAILAVGDIMLGRQVAQIDDPFTDVSMLLQQADAALGNLECAILSTNNTSETTFDPARLEPILLLAPPRSAVLLHQAGFDLLNLANNHTLDAGVAGLAETIKNLQQEELGWFGVGQGNQVFTPRLLILKGIRLAFLGYNAIPVPPKDPDVNLSASDQQEATWVVAQQNVEGFLDAIRLASRQADMVIVSIHWGYEYQAKVDPAQRNLAHRILEAGADVILGHHPHVPQLVELIDVAGRTGVVAYSLGNFLFDQEFNSTRKGLALRILVDGEGLAGVQVLDVEAGLKPGFIEYRGNKSDSTISGVPEVITYTCDQETCKQRENAVFSLDADPHSGEADLDGDGLLEEYILQGSTLIVNKGSVEAWRSPVEWQVVDVTQGDPDWNGREDLVLAFWRPDDQGVLRSQPFVMGYRHGVFRTLWGGSAVSDPILELEVGDVNNDGKDELIVLERRPDGIQNAISLWRWHGWGFSQFWRSPEGLYGGLHYLPASDGEPAKIQITSYR